MRIIEGFKLAKSVLSRQAPKEVFGGSDREEAVLAYSYDRQDAVNRVRDQEYQLALLLSPVKVEMVKAVADAGDRMPRKSTYFYPKIPSGLVFRRLV